MVHLWAVDLSLNMIFTESFTLIGCLASGSINLSWLSLLLPLATGYNSES